MVTSRPRVEKGTALRCAASGAAAALILVAGGAWADGLRFEGDLPNAPHVLINLTKAQRAELRRAASHGERRPEITLTRPQRDVLRQETGKDVRWLFAVSKNALVGDCTDGDYNLGIVVLGKRLAVLTRDLGDYVRDTEVAEMSRALVDRALPKLTWAHSPPATWRSAPPIEDSEASAEPEEYHRLVARFPGNGAFATRLMLEGGWTAARLRLAGLPRAQAEERDIAAPLHTLASVSAAPDAAKVIRWPELGARLEADGRVYLIVPGLVEGEIGPRGRAWFILAYAGGKIAGAAALSQRGRWQGAVYDWEGVE